MCLCINTIFSFLFIKLRTLSNSVYVLVNDEFVRITQCMILILTKTICFNWVLLFKANSISRIASEWINTFWSLFSYNTWMVGLMHGCLNKSQTDNNTCHNVILRSFFAINSFFLLNFYITQYYYNFFKLKVIINIYLVLKFTFYYVIYNQLISSEN